MPIIETGVWVIMAIVGTAFTFLSLKAVDKAALAFHMVAAAVFIGMAAIHAAQYEVSATSIHLTYNETGDLIFNETMNNTLIPAGTQGSWLQYLFLGLSIFNVLLVFKQVVKV